MLLLNRVVNQVTMKSYDKELLFGVIRYAIWNKEYCGPVDWAVYEELKKHAIVTLPAGVLSKETLI